MKSYSMLGINIGIEIYAESAEQAMEIAREEYLYGLGGEFIFCNEEDKQELEESGYEW